MTNLDAMENLLKIYQDKSGDELAAAFKQMLSDDVQIKTWADDEQRSYNGKDHFYKECLEPFSKKYPNSKKIVGRHYIAENQLILFYTITVDGSKEWNGCDVISFAQGQISHALYMHNTIMRANPVKKLDVSGLYKNLDKFYKPETTAKNLIGMMQLVDLKQTPMASKLRIHEVLALTHNQPLSMDSWEPKGITYLADEKAIRELFCEHLLTKMPDFYEGLTSYIIFGNAIMLLQNPSGTMLNKKGEPVFAAWYNADIYFFDDNRLQYMLFQRNTLMDENQTKHGIVKDES